MADLSKLQSDLAKYEAARDAILGGQSYEVAGRKLTRANLREVEAAIERLEQRIEIAKAGGISSGSVVFGGWHGR
ncbi:hypothetical protein [Desulfocurvibacter africanus]|uniref:Uncharacterized protein n=1 Tax=Desulfocurvibacter africanus subsp. africanus str. Walvis Bay TaxID=690850 RepID=F3Z2S3_DESAF|nr:hypothetical protein [Desulfocurvibacter africanus]EGJ50240.1 hypothetical protein Desaf_1911 [Desulfocurvibacter africanus subsp. africanus str. Walvis Bay]